ncbi:hypothetical protein [Rhodococcus sp. NCIMB 12038]|uniref:hypothetical protein n=1 Tax=Rhodococcus sp. NCIMB 12038 TaxID=933800 RepID=UPI00211ABE28|nr:hypothetical protein [Rhodococcus sp. NCIMB 12038]
MSSLVVDVDSVPAVDRVSVPEVEVDSESVPDVDCESVVESPIVDDPDLPLDESESVTDAPDDVLSDEVPSVDRSVEPRSDDVWSDESELDDADESPTDGAATAIPAGTTASPMPTATASSPKCLRCLSLFMGYSSMRTPRTAVRTHHPGAGLAYRLEALLELHGTAMIVTLSRGSEPRSRLRDFPVTAATHDQRSLAW